MNPALAIATALPGAGGGVAAAAAVAVATASLERVRRRGAVLLVEVGGERRRGPTMLAAASARELEATLRAEGLEASARGALCWVHSGADGDSLAGLRAALRAAGEPAGAAIAWLPAPLWRPALEDDRLRISGALLRADLPRQRALAALAVREVAAAGARPKVAARAPGAVAARRALAGLDPGGAAGERARRLARGLFGPRPARPIAPLPGALAAEAASDLELRGADVARLARWR